MLPLEVLRATRKIIAHANCADGIASALICLAALPEAEVVFVHHNSAEHRGLEPAEGLLFVDMTPPRERVGEFVAAGAICLDHHKKQEDIVRSFGARGIFADEKLDPGVSGAVLAYREIVYPMVEATRDLGPTLGEQMREPWAARLIRADGQLEALARLVGIRDTWQRDDYRFRTASEICEALRFVPFERLRSVEPRKLLSLLEEFGPMLGEHKLASARDCADKAVRTTLGGYHVAIVPSVTLTSDVSDVLDVDLVAGFSYVADKGGEGLRLQWSLRSRAGIDCSVIAARHPGGGGHTAAAGFSVPDDGRSPYARAPELLGEI